MASPRYLVGIAALAVTVLGSTLAQARQELVGADVYIGDLSELQQFGRVGAIVGLLGDAPVCNAGDAPLDWLTPANPHHPFMNFNLYRLKNGRLQQIGQSWTKHGLGAAQENACGFGCNPYPNGERLGVGCSDTYSASFNNGTLSFMGPRSEVNPWTGAWSYTGSHMQSQGPNHSHGPIDHRIQVHDNDLDPAQNPPAPPAGTQYFYECYVLAYDDADHTNSIAWEPATVSGAPGGTWSFNLSGSNTSIGPAINAWPGATHTIISSDPTTDGRAHLAANVTYNGGGTWRYEYAIYNHDMDRALGAFSVPIMAGAQITNAGFYAVLSHEEAYSNTPWSINISASSVSWSTQTFAVNPFANALRWGTMYNFWFDASASPGPATATLTPFKTGTPANYTGSTPGPAVPPQLGDINGDATVNVLDLLALIGAWGKCPAPPAICDADLNEDGTVNVLDLLIVIGNWG